MQVGLENQGYFCTLTRCRHEFDRKFEVENSPVSGVL